MRAGLGSPGPAASGPHQPRGAALQHLVLGHRDHVLQPFMSEAGEELGGGNTTIAPYSKASSGERCSQPRQQKGKAQGTVALSTSQLRHSRLAELVSPGAAQLD
jgi:hypothetical protein